MKRTPRLKRMNAAQRHSRQQSFACMRGTFKPAFYGPAPILPAAKKRSAKKGLVSSGGGLGGALAVVAASILAMRGRRKG
jgi:hypothetical protein